MIEPAFANHACRGRAWNVATFDKLWPMRVMSADFQHERILLAVGDLDWRTSKCGSRNGGQLHRPNAILPLSAGVRAAGGTYSGVRCAAHVEAVACLKHGMGLQTAGQRCFRSGLFEFRFLAEGARLVCPWCATVISERGRRQPQQSRMLESMSAIWRAIDAKGMQLDTVMAASRFLWAAQPHGSPHINYLGISLPYRKSPPSPSAPAPLSTLSLVWRAASIEAMAELVGLVECREIGIVPPFSHEAFRNFRGGEGEKAPEEHRRRGSG